MSYINSSLNIYMFGVIAIKLAELLLINLHDRNGWNRSQVFGMLPYIGAVIGLVCLILSYNGNFIVNIFIFFTANLLAIKNYKKNIVAFE